MLLAADTNFGQRLSPPRDVFGLSDLFQAVWRRKLLLAVMCVAGAGVAVSRVMPPVYVAEATLLAEPPSTRTRTVSELAPEGVQLPPDPAITRTMVETVGSRMILERAIATLPPRIEAVLAKDALKQKKRGLLSCPAPDAVAPEGGASEGGVLVLLRQPLLALCGLLRRPPEPVSDEPQAVRDRRTVAAHVARKLQVDNTGRSYTIRVRYVAAQPEVAAAVANAVVQEYLAYRAELNTTINSDIAASLEGKLAALSSELEDAERHTQQMREQARLSELRTGALTQQQATGLMTELLTVRMRLAQAEARLAAASGERNGAVAAGNAAAEVLNSPTIQQLRKQEAELQRQDAQLSATLGPSHPNVRSSRSEMAQTQRLIASEVDRITRSLQSEVNAARRQEAGILEALQQQEKAISANAEGQAMLRQAERQTQALAAVYDHFLLRQRELDGRRNLPDQTTRLLSAAPIPLQPTGPTTPVLLGIGAVGGTLIGASIAAVRGKRQRRNDPLILGQQALGDALDVTYLPKVPRSVESMALFVRDNPYSSYAEALHWARASLQVRLDGMDRRVVMVTSAQPREGKTTLCMALAAALTLTKQNVVVVDCDLRKPHPPLPPLPGEQSSRLTEWSDLPEELGDLEVRMHWGSPGQPNVVRFSAAVAHPHVVLCSPKFRTLINSLAAKFDYVFLDTPPLSVASDSLFVGYHADECLIVSKWRTTPSDEVRAGIADLRARNIRVSGLIINAAERIDAAGTSHLSIRAASADAAAYRDGPRSIALSHSPAAGGAST